MARKAVTIRDVARHAGVSVATASRALNGKDVVNPQTRDRILTVMEELGFSPSPAARRLSLGRTLTIGVVVSFLTRPQAAERLRGVDAVLTDSEFDLVIYNVEIGPEARPLPGHAGPVAAHRRPARDVAASRRTRPSRPCCGSPGPGRLHRCPHAVGRGDAAGRRRRCGRRRARGEASRSTSDTGPSGSSAMPLHDPFGFTSSRDREAGLTRELARAGVSIPDEWVGHGAHGRYEARDLARRMLSSRPPTDGDLHGQRHAGPRRHRRRPRARAARPGRPVGHRLRRHRGGRLRRADDRPPAAVRVRPPGAEVLLAEIDDRSEEPPVVHLAPELVVRATTAPPKEGRG